PAPVARKPMPRKALADLEISGRASLSRRADARDSEKKELASKEMIAGGQFGFQSEQRELEMERRRQVRGFYRKMPPVKEWAENNYYHVPIEQQLAARIGINAFWRDYAAHLADNK